MNIVIVGHQDHGKSTLIGRLLYDSESIHDDRISEIQKLAQEYRRRFEFAYFLDAFEDELREERTIDTVSLLFKNGSKTYTITDVPGHEEFIKNMLTGSSQADLAVLVVSATEGVQDQTRMHLFLLKLFGITNIVVAINKMDLIGYEETGFEKIANDVKVLLNSFAYDINTVTVIPLSAFAGDNIFIKSNNMSWYHGPSLLEFFDAIRSEYCEKPLRFIVQDRYPIQDGSIIAGRVESGTLYTGDLLTFEPGAKTGQVRQIRTLETELDHAEKMDSIGIMIDLDIKRGDVGGPAEQPPKVKTEFLGEAVMLGADLKLGEQVEIRCGTARVKADILRIQTIINSKTGAVIEKDASQVQKHEAAIIKFTTEPIVLERFNAIPELGRFIIIKNNESVGAGIVLDF